MWMMSGPAPEEMAAVTRAWMSLALMRSRVTLAPKTREASVICRLSTSSPAGTKSFQRRRWSVVPWPWACRRPDARIPESPPTAVNLMKTRRSRLLAMASPSSLRVVRGLAAVPPWPGGYHTRGRLMWRSAFPDLGSADSEIRALDVLARRHVRRRTLQHDAALLHHVHGLRELEGEPRVLLDEQDGHAAPVGLEQPPVHLLHDHRRQ